MAYRPRILGAPPVEQVLWLLQPVALAVFVVSALRHLGGPVGSIAFVILVVSVTAESVLRSRRENGERRNWPLVWSAVCAVVSVFGFFVGIAGGSIGVTLGALVVGFVSVIGYQATSRDSA